MYAYQTLKLFTTNEPIYLPNNVDPKTLDYLLSLGYIRKETLGRYGIEDKGVEFLMDVESSLRKISWVFDKMSE